MNAVIECSPLLPCTGLPAVVADVAGVLVQLVVFLPLRFLLTAWPLSPSCLQHFVAKYTSAAVAAAAVGVLVEAGAELDSRTIIGNTPLHWAAEYNADSAAAAAVAAALLSAGADPLAINDNGSRPVDLALEREDAADCTELVEILLRAAADSSDDEHGSSVGSGVGSSVGGSDSDFNAEFNHFHLGDPPAQPPQPECPVCLRLGANMTGPCGHLVCEVCAEHEQVRRSIALLCCELLSGDGLHCGKLY